MATKLYNNDIDKTVNWGGDPEKTNGLPVSGEKVQKFIKDTLESKFGYLYFDPTQRLYLIFADEVNFKKWQEDPDNNANLLLGNFVAPAPATIEFNIEGGRSFTILKTDIDKQKISIPLYIKQSNNDPGGGRMKINISISNGSRVNNLPVDYIESVNTNIDKDHPFDNPSLKPSVYVFENFGNYLSEGANTIKMIFTSEEFNVSSTITFTYNVINFVFYSTFNNGESISLVTNGGLEIPYYVSAQGPKYIKAYIDGEYVLSDESGDFIGSETTLNKKLEIGFANSNWATAGKHNIQFYCFILDGNNNEIQSKLLYYEFVLTSDVSDNNIYILFNREELAENIITTDTLEYNVEQYQEISIYYNVLNPSGRGNTDSGKIAINFDFLDKEKYESHDYSQLSEIKIEDTRQATVDNGGDIKEFKHVVMKPNNFVLQLSIENQGVITTKDIIVNVSKSSADINEITEGLLLKLSAKNRSNLEPEETRNKWEYVINQTWGDDIIIDTTFSDGILWDDFNGWKDNALVLSNSEITINSNILGKYSENSGLTFEIDFETFNVQDDNAPIMRYGQENTAHIFINACNAEMKSNGGTAIVTNYKDNSRQKIQFIFGGVSSGAETINEMPKLYYMVVNGVLDRVVQFTDTVSDNNTSSFTIGNRDGKVGIKIYSIKLYDRALTLDNCITNYIIDSQDILSTYKKNDLYENNQLNITKILGNHVPVMVIYGDVTTSITKLFDKKANIPVDVLYQDPNNPQFDFFATDCWMSNQGTSSMNYPRRNLRLYLNKKADKKTIRGFGSDENYKYNTRLYPGLTNMNIISKIQDGTIEYEKIDNKPTFNIVNGETTYKPLCNKKWTETDGTELSAKGSYDALKKVMTPVELENARRMWHSNIKLYYDNGSAFKAVKNFNKEILGITVNDEGETIQGQPKTPYVYGCYARFKDKDLYTDKWTIKCDYAESSMTHNAGIGRLWNDVMSNVEIGDEGITYKYDEETKSIKEFQTSNPCRTNAQSAMKEYNQRNPGIEYGDIRTSCDGYPIVIINYPRMYDSNNKKPIAGSFGEPIFLGLYNIMTDKGSTPLFGFEDLKDDDGTLIWNAGNREEDEDATLILKEEQEKAEQNISIQRTECWECLQNGSSLAQMYDIVTDLHTDDTADDNEGRYIWYSFEARWPDNNDLNLTLTNKLETLIRFVNFCKDAVEVTIDGKNAYTLSTYELLDNLDKLTLDLIASKTSYAEKLSILKDVIRNKNNQIIDSNAWNEKLYMEVYEKSPSDVTSRFYKLNSSGKAILNEDGSNQFMNLEDFNNLSDSDKVNLFKEIYYVLGYGAGASATQGKTAFNQIYNESDSIDDKINKVLTVLNNTKLSIGVIYVLKDDISNTSVKEISLNDIDPNTIHKYYFYNNLIDNTKIKKEISTKTISGSIYTGFVYTYDGKRRNEDNEILHPDAWVKVYLTPKTGYQNAYTYINEYGETTDYTSGMDITEDRSFRGKTYMDYFKAKKYEHFDVWKLAAYYVYLMRFGAVDQVIKNTMMTTDDGQHYYFINYDNDTILGVRNDGNLVYDWQIDRNSYDPQGNTFAYAGFTSVLWNLLENDSDFMEKVQTIATAMVGDGTNGVLTYNIALDMFNNKQSGTWSPRLYNNSEMYKYIATYLDSDNDGANKYSVIKYLAFLQGSRTSHREWWLRHRFDLYDSKWSAGEYSKDLIQVKFAFYADSTGAEFIRITAGSKFYYTVMTNTRALHCFVKSDDPNETENLSNNGIVELLPGQTGVFYTQENLTVGDPIRILGAYKATSIDFSPRKQYLTESISFEGNGDGWKNPSIKELNIGGTNDISCGISQISGLDRLTLLEKINVRTCNDRAFTSLNISKLVNLKEYIADNTRLTSFKPYGGITLDKVVLPTGLTRLEIQNGIPGTSIIDLDNITFSSEESFVYEPNYNLTSLTLNNCKVIDNNEVEEFDWYTFIDTWYTSILNNEFFGKLTYKCELSFKEIELTNAQLQHLNEIKKAFGVSIDGKANFEIKQGTIKVKDSSTIGITKATYNIISTETYQDTNIKVWPDETFIPNTKFNITSDIPSIFNDVEINGNRLTDIENNNINGVICGDSIKFITTVFPLTNTEPVTYTIQEEDKSYGKRNWYQDSNNSSRYYYNYVANKPSYFTINNDKTAVLDIYEYEDVSNQYLYDNKLKIYVNVQVGTRRAETYNITSDLCIKPKVNDFVIKDSNDNDFTNDIFTITEIESYDFTVKLKDGFVPNIDIIDANVYLSDENYGDIQYSTGFNIETGKFELVNIQYMPSVVNNPHAINIVTEFTLGDANQSKLYVNLKVQIETLLIDLEDLTIVCDDENGPEITKENDEFKVTKFFKNNETSSNANYTLNLQLENFNVAIKNISLAWGNDALYNLNFINVDLDNTDNHKINININSNNLNNSFYDKFKYVLSITDEFDNVTSWPIFFEIGLFKPDKFEIQLLEIQNGIIEPKNNFIDDNDYSKLNINILSSTDRINTKFRYKLNICSFVNNQYNYYWLLGNDEDPNQIKRDALITDCISINDSSVTNNYIDNEALYIKNFSNDHPLVKNGFGVNQSNYYIELTIPSDASNSIIEIQLQSKFINLTVNEYIFDDGALSQNYCYKTLEPGLYIMDSKGKFYNPDNYNTLKKLDYYANIESLDIISLTYVYTNSQNTVKKSISIDPYLLVSDKKYGWWKESTTVANTPFNIDGQHYPYYTKSTGIGWDSLTIYKTLNNISSNYYDYLYLTTSGKKFMDMINLYCLYSGSGNNSINIEGVNVRFESKNGIAPNMDLNNISNNATSIANGDITMTYTFNDDNMIFSKYNYYQNHNEKSENHDNRNFNNLNLVCSPLSRDEIIIFLNAVVYYQNNETNINKFNQILKDILNPSEDKNYISEYLFSYPATTSPSDVAPWIPSYFENNTTTDSNGYRNFNPVYSNETPMKFKTIWTLDFKQGNVPSGSNIKYAPTSLVYYSDAINSINYYRGSVSEAEAPTNLLLQCIFGPDLNMLTINN